MLESQPKAGLVKLARATLQGFVVQRHEEHFTHGVPDISVMGLQRASWWEVKLAQPDETGRLVFKSKGIQELTMLRLSVAVMAWHIVYSIDNDESKRVHIVQPSKLSQWESSPYSAKGFNHKYVVEFMLRAHYNASQNQN